MGFDHERWAWGAIALVGCALVGACIVPAYEVAIEAGSGSGADYRYEEEVTIAWDTGLLGVALLVAAVLVIAAALVACFGRARPWLAAGVLLVSVGLFAVLGLGTGGTTRWSDDATVYSGQGGSPLIDAAVAPLQTRAAASPEAQDPTWTIEGGADRFGLRRRGGGTLLFWSSVGLFWLAGYRVARLWLSRRLALLTVALATTVVIVWSFVSLLDALES